MRATFSDTLVRLAKADPNVLLLTGDHGYALFDDFRRECPAQYGWGYNRYKVPAGAPLPT
jgi:transketolase